MNNSLTNIYRFFFTYDFTMGLYKGIGVLLPVFIVYLLGGESKNLITVGYASLTIGIADQIGSFKHKRNELLLTLLGTLLITFYFAQFNGFSLSFIISLSVIVFASNFISCFGPKATTIGFTFIFIAMITGRNTYEFTEYVIDFAFGSIFYVIYALIFAKYFADYIIRQTLSECYTRLSTYLRAISECYRQNSDLDEKFANLIESQTFLVSDLQQVRDLLFRAPNKHDPKIIKMAGELTILNDIYDRLVAPYQDFATIRQHYENSDIQIFFRDLYIKAANNLEEMSMYTLGGGEMIRRLGFKAELRALEYELEIIKKQNLTDQALIDAYNVLGSHYRKAWVMNRQLDKIRQLLLDQIEVPSLGDNFKKHISHNYWSWNIFKENLSLSSDYMRFAIRTSVAMFCTLALINLILEPKQILAHSFWIAFTIVTLMRPGFSITRERSRDRIIGTIMGCALVGLIISMTPTIPYIITCITIAIILSNSLGNIDYKLSVMFITVYVLLALNIGVNITGLSLAVERILDTSIGALIAIVFTIYFLPSWEKREAPRLADRIRFHLYDLLETLENVWIKQTAESTEFYIKLKDTQALIIQLSNSLTRMQKEPQKFHGDFHYYNEFMIRQQSILSQLAILGYSLDQLSKDPKDIPEFNELVMLTKMRLDPSIPSSENTKPFTGQELKPLIWMVEANTSN